MHLSPQLNHKHLKSSEIQFFRLFAQCCPLGHYKYLIKIVGETGTHPYISILTYLVPFIQIKYEIISRYISLSMEKKSCLFYDQLYPFFHRGPFPWQWFYNLVNMIPKSFWECSYHYKDELPSKCSGQKGYITNVESQWTLNILNYKYSID